MKLEKENIRIFKKGKVLFYSFRIPALGQEIYKGLGCVNISVEPQFVRSEVSDELIELSKKYINSVTEILNK